MQLGKFIGERTVKGTKIQQNGKAYKKKSLRLRSLEDGKYSLLDTFLYSFPNLPATVRNRLMDKMYFWCDPTQSLLCSYNKTPRKQDYFCLVGWKKN